MLAKADNRSADPGSKSIRGSEKKEIENWSFVSLTGTQKERDELIKKFAGWGWTPIDFTAKGATKEALLKIHLPYILHLATHGFFAKEDPTTAQTESESSSDDPQSKTSGYYPSRLTRSPGSASTRGSSGASARLYSEGSGWRIAAPERVRGSWRVLRGCRVLIADELSLLCDCLSCDSLSSYRPVVAIISQ
jgi:hypothetical protein